MIFNPPVVEQFDNVTVVREDLIPGGTKARFVEALFNGIEEMVYASPVQGGAQTALALAARRLGKKLTLFVAAREQQHPRVLLSKQLGAEIIEIKFGMLSNVRAQARAYANRYALRSKNRVYCLEFGLGTYQVVDAIAAAARQIPRPEQIWCAAGSGTLARGIALAWPDVPRFVVRVGHRFRFDMPGSKIFVYPKSFDYTEERESPFPSDPTYERKAYRTMLDHIGDKRATFWNTAGSAHDEIERLTERTDRTRKSRTRELLEAP